MVTSTSIALCLLLLYSLSPALNLVATALLGLYLLLLYGGQGLRIHRVFGFKNHQWRYFIRNIFLCWLIAGACLAPLLFRHTDGTAYGQNYGIEGNLLLLLAAIALNIWLVKKRAAATSPQQIFEAVITRLLQLSGWVTVACTCLMVMVLFYYSCQFFAVVPLHKFLFGLNWSPQSISSFDSSQAADSFGALSIFAGTLLITLIAMSVAVPTGLMAAVFIAEYIGAELRDLIKPFIEILAGIPTVVYGYLAATVLGPAIRDIAGFFHLNIAAESALSAGMMMGVMIIPYVLSLSDDVIRSVPQNLREASLALGATKSETICKVVLPAALPGLMSAILLAMSRAIGETMIVTMAAGLTANLSMNPLASVTTVTAQIVSLLSGDQEFDSPSTLAAYGLGMVLFVITLGLNTIAYMIIKRYKKI